MAPCLSLGSLDARSSAPECSRLFSVLSSIERTLPLVVPLALLAPALGTAPATSALLRGKGSRDYHAIFENALPLRSGRRSPPHCLFEAVR
jgi:hypothetical protein